MEPRGGVKTRIALLSLTPFFGGGEVYYERLAALLREDFEMHAIVASEELAKHISSTAGVSVVRGSTGLRRIEEARRQLRELVASQDIQLAHLNGQAEANLVPTCRRLHVPCVLTRHTDLQLQSGVLKRALYRRNASRADAVVCVSRTVAQQHATFVAPEKLHLIPHWVSVAETFQRSTTRPFTVLFVGRMEPAKGVHELLTAARMLPEIQFLFAGDGPLRRDAEQSGLPNVTTLGFLSNVPALLATADLLVNPSHSEGSSLVVLEAMAAGLPCVVSDIPVLREIVQDGRAGAVFVTRNARHLAETIEAMRRDDTNRLAFAERGREIVAAAHAPDRIRERYRCLFQHLAAKSTGLPRAA